MKRIRTVLLFLCLAMTLIPPASALAYTIDAPNGANYGKPTSIEVIQTADSGAAPNKDISKNAAKIPPAFGSPTSNLLNSGTYLTPNLAPDAMAVTGTISGSNAAIIVPPSASGSAVTPTTIASTSPSSMTSAASTGFTEVTADLYYSGGQLGTLKIPAIDLSVKIYQGTDSGTLHKGVGHFENSSIWDGNVCIAGHNRGKVQPFNKLHKLELGDKITLTTLLGTRTYEVISVTKVDENDHSGLAVSRENKMTLYTCVQDERDYRWCIQAVEIV